MYLPRKGDWRLAHGLRVADVAEHEFLEWPLLAPPQSSLVLTRTQYKLSTHRILGLQHGNAKHHRQGKEGSRQDDARIVHARFLRRC